MDSDYEWDDNKSRSNLDKHGLGFESVNRFDWDSEATTPNYRHGELRFVAYGYIGERLHTVVYAIRGDKKRIISLRRASRREERQYESQSQG